MRGGWKFYPYYREWMPEVIYDRKILAYLYVLDRMTYTKGLCESLILVWRHWSDYFIFGLWNELYIGVRHVSLWQKCQILQVFMNVVKKIKPSWRSITIEHCIVNKWRNKSKENVQGTSLLCKRTNIFK